jgi:hypothetical protein
MPLVRHLTKCSQAARKMMSLNSKVESAPLCAKVTNKKTRIYLLARSYVHSGPLAFSFLLTVEAVSCRWHSFQALIVDLLIAGFADSEVTETQSLKALSDEP